MREPAVPILAPCDGVSARGDRAEEVAASLAERGLAEIVEDIEAIVAAAREGREVIALDGCAVSCQGRLLDARRVQALRTLTLGGEEADRAGSVAASASVEEIEAAAAPHRRTRRAAGAPAGELSLRGPHSVSVERLDEPNGSRPRALADSGVPLGARLRDVTVNETAEMVAVADGAAVRRSISLALAGSVLVSGALPSAS